MIIPKDNYITYSLAALILIVSLYAMTDKKVFQALILHPASVIHKNEYYRLVSSALVHNNIPHLAINLFIFYVFCSGLEEARPGPGLSGLVAIGGGRRLGGHLLSLWLYRKDFNYSCAGASGVIFGFLCSFLFIYSQERHLIIPGIGAIPNIFTAIGYLAVMLIYSMKYNDGKVDYSIHVGGGIGGVVTTLLMYPSLLTTLTKKATFVTF